MELDEARTLAAGLDDRDPLRHLRESFDIPDGTLYFDGNSLGPLTHRSREVLHRAIEHEWRERLIRSWNEDWRAMPERVGDRIAPLIGAPAGTVVVCDNTSINLHKALMAAAGLRRGRSEIVVDIDNFPTDIYIAKSVADQHGMRLTAVPAAEIPSAITDATAVVSATHVDYRTARILDAESITRAAHGHGAMMVWDLAHTAGALPFDATGLDTDFAVGCGYKYLNGGPGAPAFIYVAPRLMAESAQPLTGWWGHAEPFAFEVGYRAANGVARFLTGTPHVLSMKSLEAALEVFEGVSLADLRAKSLGLTGLFIDLFDAHLAPRGFSLGTPRDPSDRGSHVALGFDGGEALVARLAAADVIADFRPPNLMRFGFAPLYNRYSEVVELVTRLVKS